MPIVVDLFAGAGGASLGFTQAGFKVVTAVELDRSAVDTYRANLDVSVLEADLAGLQPRRLREQCRLDRGALDVLIGCPPCQGFSTMRNRKGSTDARNDLLLRMVDFVDELLPRFVFMENVPGLLRTGHGSAVYSLLVERLNELGYGVHAREVNAADYGAPQNRRRVIILAGRDGILPPVPWETHGAPKSAAVRHGFRKPWRTVRQAIAHLPDQPRNAGGPDVPNHDAANLGERVSQFISFVPRDGGSRTDVPEELWLDCHVDHKGHADVYGRLSWDNPSNTITTGCTNPSKGRFVHPEQDRAITQREAAALQGFPDDFVFCGTNIGRQIGNAVPPPLARAFAKELFRVSARGPNTGLEPVTYRKAQTIRPVTAAERKSVALLPAPTGLE